MKKKKLWLVTGVARRQWLAAGTVTFAYQSGSDSEEQAVYKEVTVEKGNLTAGVTESGSVTIGTLDQTLDFSEDSSSAKHAEQLVCAEQCGRKCDVVHQHGIDP